MSVTTNFYGGAILGGYLAAIARFGKSQKVASHGLDLGLAAPGFDGSGDVGGGHSPRDDMSCQQTGELRLRCW